MRYPVGKDKQDYIDRWYIAQGFGNQTSYGFHEGIDLNLKSGGNTDLGQPIVAIANWKWQYYHINSHPTKNFGIHYAYKIEGAWGTRWVHCAHNQLVIRSQGDNGNEGDELSRLGNSGTTTAHLHFAIFKVDPSTLPNGIDTIAKTKDQLNQWWEDPVPFIEKWMDPPIDWEAKYHDLERQLNECQNISSDRKGRITELESQNTALSRDLGSTKAQLEEALKAAKLAQESLKDFIENDQLAWADRLEDEQDAHNITRGILNDLIFELEEIGKLPHDSDKLQVKVSRALEAMRQLRESKEIQLKVSDYSLLLVIGGKIIWQAKR